MSKIIFVLCLLAIVTLATCSENAETNTENADALDIFQGSSRVKRGWFCWKQMVKTCCKNNCRGDGCVRLMCDACC